jgi:serine/threonine protein kinase
MSANPEPFPVPFVTQIGLELLDILAAAHLAGVVHRDVKPSNVFLLQGGSLKLVDFGVAYLTDTNEGDRITASGAIVGTPAFMSPEQARGRFDQVDARTDVWAVAAVLVAMLTRSELHRGTTKNEVLVSAATQPIPPIASLRADVPSTICEVLDRALSFSREDRYRDAGEMLVALRQAASCTRDHAAYRAREFVKTADTLITSNGGDSTTAELAHSITDQQKHSRSIGHRVGVVGVFGALIIGGGLLSGLVQERRRPLPSLPTVTDSKVATVLPVVDQATIATSPPLASSPTMTTGIQLSPPASGRSTTTKVNRTRLAPTASVQLQAVAAPISSQAANPITPATNAIDPLDRR